MPARGSGESSSCKRSTTTEAAPPGDRAVGDDETVDVLDGVLDDVTVAEAEPDEEAVSLLLGVSDAVPDPDDDGDAVSV